MCVASAPTIDRPGKHHHLDAIKAKKRSPGLLNQNLPQCRKAMSSIAGQEGPPCHRQLSWQATTTEPALEANTAVKKPPQ